MLIFRLTPLIKAYIHGHYRLNRKTGERHWVDSYTDKRPERGRTEFAHWTHRKAHFEHHLAHGRTREALHAFHDLGHDDSHKLAAELGLHDGKADYADKKTLMGAIYAGIGAKRDDLKAKIARQVKADWERRKQAGQVGKAKGIRSAPGTDAKTSTSQPRDHSNGPDLSAKTRRVDGTGAQARSQDRAKRADHWDALARALSPATIEGLRTRAERGQWPGAFIEKLTSALGALPPNVRAYFDWHQQFRGESVRIIYRTNLDDVPDFLHSTYESAAAITVNGSRIEFVGDRFPSENSLRHELIHYTWSDIGGADTPAVQSVLDDVVADGEKMLKLALSRKRDGDDLMLEMDAKRIARTMRRMRKYQKAGDYMPEVMRKVLELELMVPAKSEVAAAVGINSEDGQYAIVARYMAMAKRLGVKMDGGFADEEGVAYRCGEQASTAEVLFGAVADQLERKLVDKNAPKIEPISNELDVLFGKKIALESERRQVGATAQDRIQTQLDQVKAAIEAHQRKRTERHSAAMMEYAKQNPRWYDITSDYAFLRATPKAVDTDQIEKANRPRILFFRAA